MKLVIKIWRGSFWPYRLSNEINITNQDDEDYSHILEELERILKSLKKQIIQKEE